MLKLPKAAAVAVQATLWVALSSPWATLADAAPANTATQSQTTPRLHKGDLVQLPSGGPVLTVKSVSDNWVICTWFDDYGELQSTAFPIAMIAGPVTLSPDDAKPQTNGQMSPTEPSVRRSGDSSSSGQTNQQVRPANEGTSMSPSTRPARVLPLQQGTGSVGPAPVLPRGTVQTVIPLQQGTGTHPTIPPRSVRIREGR